MARKKPFEVPEFAHSGRVGLAVMRMQPLHKGHTLLVKHMLEDCDTVIIGFGSCQLSRSVSNPFTFEQRLEMLRVVFGDNFKPIQLIDIDSNIETDDWVNYVLDKIAKSALPDPTDYYTGSAFDASWYANAFASTKAPAIRNGELITHESAFGKRLHILSRDSNGVPPASALRSLIERRSDEWKQWVPARLIPYIEHHYPGELRMAIKAHSFPSDAPIGTKVIRMDKPERPVFIFNKTLNWEIFPATHEKRS